MYRYRKIWIAAILAVLMICLLSGCGKRPGPGEIMKKMSDAVNRQTGFGIDASITQEGQADAEDSRVDVRILRHPTDTNPEFYVKLNGEWIRRAGSVGISDMDRTLKKLFVDYRDMMHLSENDATVDGRACYEMTAVMIPFDLIGLLQDAANQLKAAGIPKNIWDQDILESVTARMDLLVDQETYLPRSMSIRVNRDSETSVTMDYAFGFTGISELALPDEALHLPETEPETEDVPVEEPVLYEAPAGAEILVEFGEKEYALFGNDQVQVYMMRVMRTVDDELITDLNLVNSNGTELDVYTESVALNHRMIHTTNLFQHVKGGSEVIATMTIEGLEDNGIEELGAMSLQLGAVRSVDGQDVLDSSVQTFVFFHGKEYYSLPEEEKLTVLFEDEALRVTAGEIVREDEQVKIPLYMENLGEETCTLTLDGIRDVTGLVALPDHRIYGELQPDSLLYAELVFPAELEASIPEEMGEAFPEGLELMFRVSGRNLRTMTTLFSCDEIHLVIPPVKTEEETEATIEGAETVVEGESMEAAEAGTSEVKDPAAETAPLAEPTK